MHLPTLILLSVISFLAFAFPTEPSLSYGPVQSSNRLDSREDNTAIPQNSTGNRNVYLIENIYVSGPTVYSPTYDRLVLAVHCAIEFGPTSTDGALRVEIIAPVERQYAIRAVDSGFPNAEYIPPFQYLNGYIDQEVELLGNTTLTNQQIIDPKTGDGLINSAWGSDRSFRIDGHNSVDLVQAMARQLGLTIPDVYQTTFQEAKKYTQGRGLNTVYDTIALDYVLFTSLNRGTVNITEYQFGTGSGISLVNTTKWESEKLVFAPADTDPTTPFNTQRIVGHPDDPNAACGGASRIYSGSQGALPARDVKDDPCKVKPNATVFKLRLGTTKKDVAAARIQGKLKLITQVIEDAVKYSGLAALIANPTIIILDLVNGQFQAAAFGAVGFVVGVAVDLLISGPIGWLAAAFVVAFFAILPGFFKQVKTPPSNNVMQILQWSFFGDATHTGNEKCNKNLTAAGQPANCTAVYGPGVIASVLKWENFDAIAFMIDKNQGHAMSIGDIAAGLYPIDHASSDNGTGAVATVDCGAYYPVLKRSLIGRTLDKILPRQWAQIYHEPQHSKNPAALSTGYTCDKPTYKLKRQLVTIPVLNLTADQVYPRIIGPKGGDCKLLADAAEPLDLIGYNMRLTGRPAAMACNITARDQNFGNGAVGAPNAVPSVTGSDGGAYSSTAPPAGTSTATAVTSTDTASTVSVSIASATSTSSTSPTNAPITLNVTGGYNFLSCNTDDNDSRTIGPAQIMQDSVNSTNCAQLCKGSAYFGLEYGFQCFCGDFISPNSNITDKSECGLPCRGNTSESCGGTNRILIYEYSSSSYVSPANTTSDSSVGRARVQAPQPPPGFANLTAADTVCLTWSGQQRCFPSGEYDLQRGSLGFSMNQAKDLLGPLGATIKIPTVSTTGGRPAYKVIQNRYAANQTGNKAMQDSLSRCMEVKDGTGFIVNITSNTALAVCLFTKTNYLGDVICLGKGGGNLTDQFANKAQSIRVFGGARAWIYPQAYDDTAGQAVNGDIADLSNVAYGTSSNMLGKVMAIWIDDSKPGKVKKSAIKPEDDSEVVL